MQASATLPRSKPIELSPLGVALLAPVALWAVLFVVLPPGRQDFPYNDDWCYARGAFAFYHGEGIQYYNWASTPQLGQWLWAYPFVRLLGENFVALRLSTIILGLLGGAAFYYLLRREAEVSPRPAAFATAVLLLNPLYFLLAGTFMTDVPAVAFSLIVLAFYSAALREGSTPALVAGTAVALLAVTTRQNTVTAPAAAGAVLLWRHPRLWRRPAWLLALGLVAAVWLFVLFWFKARPDVVKFTPLAPNVDRTAGLFWAASVFLGLAALPLLLLVPRTTSRRGLLVALGLILAAGAVWAGYRRFILDKPLTSEVPFLGNTVTPWGMFGVPIVVGGRPPQLLDFKAFALIGLAGLAAGAVLLARLAGRLRSDSPVGLVPVFTLLHLPFMLVAGTMFDRYLLALMPGVFYLLASGPFPFRPRWPVALVALTGFALVSLGLMHDWLAWNSARWELGRRALARGIAVEDIEGGFEWGGWHFTGRHVSEDQITPRQGLDVPGTPLFVPLVMGRYALARVQPDGTVRRDAEPYTLWLAPGRREFLLVEKPLAGPAQP